MVSELKIYKQNGHELRWNYNQNLNKSIEEHEKYQSVIIIFGEGVIILYAMNVLLWNLSLSIDSFHQENLSCS